MSGKRSFNEKLEDIIIDFGDLKLTAKEMLEIIREEKVRILKEYDAESFDELLERNRYGRLDQYTLFSLKAKLSILDQMEQSIFEEVEIRTNRRAFRIPAFST